MGFSHADAQKCSAEEKKIVNGTVLARWDPDIGPLSSYDGVLLQHLHIK